MMNNTIHESNSFAPTVFNASDESQRRLTQAIAALESSLTALESLGLTFAVALLDHAMAEAKRHLVC